MNAMTEPRRISRVGLLDPPTGRGAALPGRRPPAAEPPALAHPQAPLGRLRQCGLRPGILWRGHEAREPPPLRQRPREDAPAGGARALHPQPAAQIPAAHAHPQRSRRAEGGLVVALPAAEWAGRPVAAPHGQRQGHPHTRRRRRGARPRLRFLLQRRRRQPAEEHGQGRRKRARRRGERKSG